MFKLPNLLNRNYFQPTQMKIIKNVYWSVLGKIVGILSSFIVGVLVARYLGPEQYGIMSYVISYVTLFSIIATFGLDGIEIRELSKKDSDKNTILGSAFAIRMFFSVLTILIIVISLVIFETDRFTFLMVLVYSSSIILSPFNVIRNYFTSIVYNEYIVKTEIIRIIVGSGIKIILLLNHFPLSWFIFGSVLELVLIAGGYTYSYRKKVDTLFLWKYNSDVSKMLLKESFPLLLSGTTIMIYMKIDQIMIRNMIDNASLGLYSIAIKLNEMTVFIPTVIAQTVTPILVKAHQNNIDDYNEKRQKLVSLMVWSSIIMALIILLVAKPVINILMGNTYSKAVPVLQILAWQGVFIALSSSSGQLIIIENLQKFAIIRNLIGCMVSIILNLILIPKYGIIGSAVITIITVAFSGYLSHSVIKPLNHLFKLQTKSIYSGWRIFANYKNMKKIRQF